MQNLNSIIAKHAALSAAQDARTQAEIQLADAQADLDVALSTAATDTTAKSVTAVSNAQALIAVRALQADHAREAEAALEDEIASLRPSAYLEITEATGRIREAHITKRLAQLVPGAQPFGPEWQGAMQIINHDETTRACESYHWAANASEHPVPASLLSEIAAFISKNR